MCICDKSICPSAFDAREVWATLPLRFLFDNSGGTWVRRTARTVIRDESNVVSLGVVLVELPELVAWYDEVSGGGWDRG